MKNINYKYNPETLEYEEVRLTLWDRTKKLSYYLVASIVFSFLILTVAFYKIRNYIQKLRNNLDDQVQKNLQLNEKITTSNNEVNQLKSNIIDLIEQIKLLKLANQIEGKEIGSNKDVKLLINEMVREIDKGIALLKK